MPQATYVIILSRLPLRFSFLEWELSADLWSAAPVANRDRLLRPLTRITYCIPRELLWLLTDVKLVVDDSFG